MKNFIEKIKASYSHISSSSAKYDTEELNPKKSWEVILLFTFVVFVISVGFATYFYMSVDGGTFFVKSEDSGMNEVKINTDLLKKTVDDINLRETQSTTIKQKSIPTDPLQ